MKNWRKGIATWAVGKVLYISVPFTWLVPDAEKIARNWKGKALIGGPGLMRPTFCDGFEPINFHNPCATYTTRGCPNRCPFCAVDKLEPTFEELPNYRPAPIICDNNFTAASVRHQARVIEKQKVFPFTDFNQGLEARRFTPELADLLGVIHCKVRFAFDHWNNEATVKDAVDLCRQRATKDIGVYCLIGFDDDPESAIARLELVRSWGIDPNPMRYQPIEGEYSLRKNSYIHPDWTEEKLSNVMRYYSKLQHLRFLSLEQYKAQPEEQLALIED